MERVSRVLQTVAKRPSRRTKWSERDNTCQCFLLYIPICISSINPQGWYLQFRWNVNSNMMDRSNFWSMQLFQTGPHFKLEEVWFWKGIFPSWHNHPRSPRGSQSGWEKGRDESFQVRAKEPLGADSHRTISKNSSGFRLLIGHKKCFVLLCPIGEQFLLRSFSEFVHNGYCFHHGLSGSCTKEMPAVRKLSVWYKIPTWFQNTVCTKTKDAFPKIQA